MTEGFNPKPKDVQHASTEREQHAYTGWMFDIDGVITNPDTKQIKFPEIGEFLAERITAGEPVGLITGRALPWVMERVVPHVKNLVKDPAHLSNFFVSGEFGASYTTWKDGKEQHFVDPSIRVTDSITQEVKTASQKYSTTLHIDPDKETMVSLEMNDGLTVDMFKPDQAKLAPELKEIVAKHDTKGEFEVHVDRIATNVRNKKANKYYAAQQFVKWANAEGRRKPEIYLPFGDSAADAEMPAELKRMNLPYEFVYVGGKEQLVEENKKLNEERIRKNEPIIDLDKLAIRYMQGHCDEGVVEFIKDYRKLKLKSL